MGPGPGPHPKFDDPPPSRKRAYRARIVGGDRGGRAETHRDRKYDPPLRGIQNGRDRGQRHPKNLRRSPRNHGHPTDRTTGSGRQVTQTAGHVGQDDTKKAPHKAGLFSIFRPNPTATSPQKPRSRRRPKRNSTTKQSGKNPPRENIGTPEVSRTREPRVPPKPGYPTSPKPD